MSSRKPEMSIQRGSIVELCNLRNAEWLNGHTAEVLSVDPEKRRYEIRLAMDGSVKKVKAENVVLSSLPAAEGNGGSAPTAANGAGDSSPGGDAIPAGSTIELCNLRSAAHLNGEKATVIARDAEKQRYEIRLLMDENH